MNNNNNDNGSDSDKDNDNDNDNDNANDNDNDNDSDSDNDNDNDNDNNSKLQFIVRQKMQLSFFSVLLDTEETELRLTVRLGLTVLYFPIFRQARPDFLALSRV